MRSRKRSHLAQGLESLDNPLIGTMLTPSSTVKLGLVVDGTLITDIIFITAIILNLILFIIITIIIMEVEGTLVSILVASTVFLLTVTLMECKDKDKDKD